MKMSKYFFLGLLSLGLVFTGCDDDDDDEQPQACAAPTDLLVDASGTNAVTISFMTTAANVTVEYGVTGFAQGTGTQVSAAGQVVTVDGLMPDTQYDFYVQANCGTTNSTFAGPLTGGTVNPIVGTWEAYDVSGVLANLGITGITAEFNGDQTYVVVSSAGGAEANFEGTYTVSEDPVNGIYSIELNQSVPNTLTSEGIFQVYSAMPDSMWYEVAQTDPAITGVTAPTVAAGFGSTSGGAFGTANIQKYNRTN